MDIIKVSRTTLADATGNPYGYGWNGINLNYSGSDNGLHYKLICSDGRTKLAVFNDYTELIRVPANVEKINDLTAVITCKKNDIKIQIYAPSDSEIAREQFNNDCLINAEHYADVVNNWSAEQMQDAISDSCNIITDPTTGDYYGCIIDVTIGGPTVWINTQDNKIYYHNDTVKREYQLNNHEKIDAAVIERFNLQ